MHVAAKFRPRLLISVCILLAAGWFCWFAFMGGRQRMKSQAVISAIEADRQREGRLPDPVDTALMRSLGFELREGFHPDYRRISGTDYVVTVLEGFDGP